VSGERRSAIEPQAVLRKFLLDDLMHGNPFNVAVAVAVVVVV